MNATQVVSVVHEPSHVGAARRQAVSMATAAGFGETDAGRVALIATELGNNLERHGGGGRLLTQVIQSDRATQLELLSIDSGPGMNAEQCLRDGFSSGGTAGQGLGAIKRLSQDFELYSRPGSGCVVMSRVQPLVNGTQPVAKSRWRWGAVNAPAPGEKACGDTWRMMEHNGDVSTMMADGLGHGLLASEAAQAAANVFETEPFGALVSFFTRAHVLLRPTRGAAVAAALCPAEGDTMQFSGVGNIAASVVSRDGQMRRLMSHNGTVGAHMRTAQTLHYSWRAGDRLVLHSDGLTARWSFADYPDLFQYHPAILSALLFRDHVRGKDDATVLVVERPVS